LHPVLRSILLQAVLRSQGLRPGHRRTSPLLSAAIVTIGTLLFPIGLGTTIHLHRSADQRPRVGTC
jgi:hypothetical protein